MLEFLKNLTRNGDDSFTATITPFSERPENRALADQIRNITGPGASFATDFLAAAPEAGVTVSTRHQAEYSPDDKFWYLVEIKRFQGGGDLDGLFKRDIQARTQHAFDALHYCAEFQAFGKKNGLTVIDHGADHWRNMRHWREGAKELSLPIAENGALLLPQKDGAALPSGYFREEQILSAQKSFKHAVDSIDPAKLKHGCAFGDKGIFIGFYDVKEKKVCEHLTIPENMVAIFAAPTDLKMPDGKTNLCGTFNEQADRIKALRNWHGHDGEPLKAPNLFCEYAGRTQQRLKKLQEGEGTGWFIGGEEMHLLLEFSGKNGKIPEIFKQQKTMNAISRPWCYWTASGYGTKHTYKNYGDNTIGDGSVYKDEGLFSVRPMRAERLILPK